MLILANLLATAACFLMLRIWVFRSGRGSKSFPSSRSGKPVPSRQGGNTCPPGDGPP